MPLSKEACEKRAIDCLKLAKAATNPDSKAVLLQLAEQWLTLSQDDDSMGRFATILMDMGLDGGLEERSKDGKFNSE